MRLAWLLMFCAWIPLQAANTFYVDSVQGRDENSGQSIAAPWKTLERVNQAEFHPGDRILLKSGSRWQGQLVPKGSGSPGRPLVIDSYGGTAFPRIDGMGRVDDVVRLYNIQQIEIHHLEITNQNSLSAVRRGVHVVLDNFGTAQHIVLSGLYIHDVNGTNQIKDNGGIIFRTKGEKKPSRFDGLLIEKNIIWKVDRSGIAADSFHASREHWFPSLGVIIQDNYVADVSGDGIVPWATDGAVVEHNIVRDCNQSSGVYNAGIWPWSTDNTLIRWNEAFLTHTTRDGQGFDSDFNSRNSVFEFNYSHDNDGGFILICSPGDADPSKNIGNTGTVVRYNISRNDHSRLVNLSGEVKQTLFERNAIYIAPEDDVQLLVSDWNGWPSGATFRGNSFYIQGNVHFGHALSRKDDGSYLIASGWKPATSIVFEGNEYFGSWADPPQGELAVARKFVVSSKLNWAEPSFEPSRPDTYESFLEAHRKWMIELFQTQFGEIRALSLSARKLRHQGNR